MTDREPRRRILEVAAAILLTMIIVVTIVSVMWSRRETSKLVDVHSLAVLPFTEDGGVGEHVSDGLTELLIDELATLPDLRVIARGSAFHFKGTPILLARVGETLHVNAVVTGDVRRAGEHYVVHAELNDVRDGGQLWSGQYDAAPAELSLVPRRIFADLASALRGRATSHPAAQKYSRNAEAYEQYLLGLAEWNARRLDASVRHFQRAIELEPQFAAAHAGLANAYGAIPAEDGTTRLLASARKALELDPNNAQALTSIATNSFNHQWDFDGAERAWRRAIELNPSSATAHQSYGLGLLALGRFDEAQREIDLAYSLDPLSPAVITARRQSRYFARQSREALGVSAADDLAIARRHASLGQPDPAFASLERAYERRDASMPGFHLHPEFDTIRNDPRFHDLAKRIGLPRSALDASAALANKMH